MGGGEAEHPCSGASILASPPPPRPPPATRAPPEPTPGLRPVAGSRSPAARDTSLLAIVVLPQQGRPLRRQHGEARPEVVSERAPLAGSRSQVTGLCQLQRTLQRVVIALQDGQAIASGQFERTLRCIVAHGLFSLLLFGLVGPNQDREGTRCA